MDDELIVLATRDAYIGRGDAVWATIRFAVIGDERTGRSWALCCWIAGPWLEPTIPRVPFLLGPPRSSVDQSREDADSFERWLMTGVGAVFVPIQEGTA